MSIMGFRLLGFCQEDAASAIIAKKNPVIPCDLEYSMDFESVKRSYLVHIPVDYDGNKKMPLIIVLHGEDSNNRIVAKMTNFCAKADKEGFIVVYPNGSGMLKKRLTWNAVDCCGYAMENKVNDVGFIKALIEKLEQDYVVDPRRVYVVGFSNGGMLAYGVACQLSGKITAIGVVSGAMYKQEILPKQPVSAIIFHGTADAQILYEGVQVEKDLEMSKRQGGSVKEAALFWVKHNNCWPQPQVEEKANIVHEVFSGGKNGSMVELYTIKGGNHSWPGGKRIWGHSDIPNKEINATDLISAFFQSLLETFTNSKGKLSQI